MSKYSNLVEEIDKQEEVKEQKANLDNELQLLKQAISNLHDSIQKVEKCSQRWNRYGDCNESCHR